MVTKEHEVTAAESTLSQICCNSTQSHLYNLPIKIIATVLLSENCDVVRSLQEVKKVGSHFVYVAHIRPPVM
jgi:hypothetical protein